MARGPFGSNSGVGRADAPWDGLNLVKTTEGEDLIAKGSSSGDPEVTPQEALKMIGRGEEGLSEEVYDVVIVGAGLSGATMAERLSNKMNKGFDHLKEELHRGKLRLHHQEWDRVEVRALIPYETRKGLEVRGGSASGCCLTTGLGTVRSTPESTRSCSCRFHRRRRR